MKSPSTALLSYLAHPQQSIWAARGCLFRQPPQQAEFSTTQTLQKRNRGAQQKRDPRIKLIRYFLQHGLTPRPLRFSRTRYLRHWTITRAWAVHQSNLARQREIDLQRQYISMRDACEALRQIDNYGLSEQDRLRLGEAAEDTKETGRLFRIAMLKNGVWNNVPIEYARIQTDWPSKEGWNHGWKR